MRQTNSFFFFCKRRPEDSVLHKVQVCGLASHPAVLGGLQRCWLGSAGPAQQKSLDDTEATSTGVGTLGRLSCAGNV